MSNIRNSRRYFAFLIIGLMALPLLASVFAVVDNSVNEQAPSVPASTVVHNSSM